MSFSVFSQIGQMSGHSHQNRSVARGCISGKNISAQPCAKVKLFLPCACPAECCMYQLPVICNKRPAWLSRGPKSNSKSVGKLCYLKNCVYLHYASPVWCIRFPSSRVVKLWKESLSKVNQKAADALADPTQYSNLFPGLQQALLAEQYLKETHVGVRHAAEYPLIMVSGSQRSNTQKLY